MRISTGMIFDSGVSTMQERTSAMLRTQQQVASGRRVLTPADDPAAAARALEVNQSQSINQQYRKAQDSAKGTLSIMSGQLSSVNDLLNRVRQLAVLSGNPTNSAADRQSIATELRTRFNQLVGLANSTDGAGQYLFSGFQGGTKPFEGTADTGITYFGDGGARTLQVSGSRYLPTSDSGNDLFMRVKNDKSISVAAIQAPQSANANHITYEGTASITNPPATTGSFNVNFWTDPATSTTYYDLVDAAGNSLYTGTPSTTGGGGTYTHAYTSGSPITLTAGASNYNAQIVFTGTPADGDSFAVNRTAAAITVTGQTFFENTPRASIDAGTVTDPVKWSQSANKGNFEVRFWVDAKGAIGAAGSTYYDLVDATTGKSLFTGTQSTTGVTGTYNHPYTSNAPISLSSPGGGGLPAFDFGATVTVSGIPAGGDAFTIRSYPSALSNGYFITAPKMTAGQGSGVVATGKLTDEGKWNSAANSKQLQVRFWKDPTNTMYYDLVDAASGKSLFSDTASAAGGPGNTYSHVFHAGEPIPFSGLAPAYGDFGATITFKGTPSSGEAYKVSSGVTQSIFETMSGLIKAVEADADPTGNATLTASVDTALIGIDAASENLLRVQADVGTRINELTDLTSVSSSLNLQYSSTLSNLQDVDYAKAITDMMRSQMQLQAAQQSFGKVAQMSLFNYL